MSPYILVFLGGGLGSVLRYMLGKAIPADALGTSFPLSILTVNILASVVLGATIGWVAGRPEAEPWRLLIGVGLCGGLSTFSSFSQDNLLLLQQGRVGVAFINISLNVVGCLLASAVGWWLTTK
ncbi:fluoride efflux transporter CrcB [Fibrivirga algicola]|uniref:Fluoride-specific ion channel FluC n=1 Tax=Fibrivirga algicola TaxID=2950420 RepID=A0ABX0QHN8_9BACT|nr:fluoride efflux transporter CrcB [Fibrivirga algicola]NID11749.1 fluoride efflux transporter CrcB [Fibrivirga algicola]